MEVPKDICLRCGGNMAYRGKEQLQLGNTETSWIFFRNYSFNGSIEMELWVCEQCCKVEFYVNPESALAAGLPEDRMVEDPFADPDATPQKICPRCAIVHDFDFPKCPDCGYLYSFAR